MYTKKMKAALISTCAAVSLGFTAGAASSQTLEEIFAEVAERNQIAQASQTQIDQLSQETSRLLQEYKTVMKEVEGLRVYNAQIQRQIDSQEQEMAELRDSIERVTLIERQITPLMIRMVDALDQFIGMDVPFLMDERQERVETLRAMMDRADVSPSEKFRRVFEAYQIEMDYGRTIEAYESTLPIDGGERRVNMLRVGRVVLAYQTVDGQRQGVWNHQTEEWAELGDEFASSIDDGIRIATQQTAPDLVRLPVHGPESVSGPEGTE